MIKKDTRNIEKILISYLKNKVFTGCALGVSRLRHEGIERWSIFEGKTDTEKDAEEVERRSFFDLASLTKPLVTALSLLSLVREGKISFEEKLDSLLPIDVPADKKNIRLAQLLGHRSGLPAHREYFREAAHAGGLSAEKLAKAVLQEKLENKPGKEYIYSDLGYMLLGEIIKWKSGGSIESLWRTKITEPLGISENFRCYGSERDELKISFVSTGQCPLTEITLKGQVHDDNCRAAGEMMGHTGLFANLDGVMFLCEDILLNCLGRRRHPSYTQDDLLLLLNMKSKRCKPAAFDAVTGAKPSSGSYFSEQTIGHLGFTGTSFWIDLKKKTVVVLLTNRVVYGFGNDKIKEMRPHVHDAVMEELIGDTYF